MTADGATPVGGFVMKKVYGFYVRQPAAGKRGDRLFLCAARSAEDATQHVHARYGAEAYGMAMPVGSLSMQAALRSVLPESGIDNPVQALSALAYVEAEYGYALRPDERAAIRKARERIADRFFSEE